MKDLEILKAACCVAGVDGRIDDGEREALAILAKQAGVGQASFNAMIEMAVENKDFFKENLALLKDDAERTIRVMGAVAVGEDGIRPQERELVESFAEKLGMEKSRCDALLAEVEQEAKSGAD